MAKFLCVSLSPTIQRTVSFGAFYKNSVNRANEYRLDASGKALNSARVLNQIEKSCVRVACPLGRENTALFKQLAAADGLAVNSVETPGRTRECWTLLDAGDGGTTELVVPEPMDLYDCTDAEERLLKIVGDEILMADAVLLAGSVPSCWSDGIVPCIAKMVKHSGKILLADYCGENLLRTLSVCVPDVVKINEEEFSRTFGLPLFVSEEGLKGAVASKSREFGTRIVVTRGKKSTFASDNGEFTEFAAESVRAVNTTACGDSFSAGFLYEFANGGDFLQSLARGTWCAARNAESKIPGSIV